MAQSVQWLLAAILGVVFSASVHAQSEQFYRDKTIRFIVGYSPGGSFDAYTRSFFPSEGSNGR